MVEIRSTKMTALCYQRSTIAIPIDRLKPIGTRGIGLEIHDITGMTVAGNRCIIQIIHHLRLAAIAQPVSMFATDHSSIL